MKKFLVGMFLVVAAFLPACGSAEAATCGCGFEKGTEQCCDENAERCGDCSKIKGSPGCCVE